jgi:C_GCAxxG_C_C family probable redox protein
VEEKVKNEQGVYDRERGEIDISRMRPSVGVEGCVERILFPERQNKESRRRFLARAGAGVALGLTGLLAAKVRAADIFTAIESGERLNIGSEGEKIIEKAYKLGYDYEKEHGGCARCSVAALQDAIDFIPVNNDIFRAAGCLDGGATPTGIQSCGAFTGCGIVIGYLCGQKRERFKGRGRLSHKLIRQVYEKYKENYGSVLCRDVKEKMQEYPDKCPRVVGRACRWTAEAILIEFTDYKQKAEVTRRQAAPLASRG